MKKTLMWGIDLGGTKTEGVVMKGGDNPEIISRLRIPTEKEKGYVHIINQIQKLLLKLEDEVSDKPSSVGIGIPGTLEPSTRTVKNANTTVLNGKPFKDDLEKALGLTVKLNNDANCFALAESRFGAAKNYAKNLSTIFGVIMGTGVGGGIIADNKILSGKQGIAGEWGHNFLDESGGKCYCGKTGCVETVISGPALERYYQNISGRKKSLKEINKLHEEGKDEKASETINRLCSFFGKAIAQVINIIDPEIVILGGGVGNINSLYTKGYDEAKKYVFNNKLETEFKKPLLGDSAGVIGAAYQV
ncbi:MAG: ROK family protein [Bacteroidales bacterium]